MKEYALKYLEKGASIIPCQKDKKPLIQWKKYVNQKPTKEEIEEWFEEDHNIGLICGKISNYTVIDLDNKHGRDLLAYAKELGFPETTTIKTPSGGYHLYYKYNPNWKTGVRVYEDVDVRNDGSYVLMPPSEGLSGEKYEVVKQATVAELPDDLGQQKNKAYSNTDWGQYMFGVTSGMRNDTAAKVAGLFISKLKPEEAWQALVVWNGQNSPPLPDHELKNTFMSILNRDKSKELTKEDLQNGFKVINMTELVDRSMQELNATVAEECVSFGYDFLDEKMTGLFPGELLIIGGETGIGKTTFATKMVYNAASKQNVKTVILALEDRLNDYGIKAVYFELGRVRKEMGLKNYPWNEYRKNNITDPGYKEYLKKAVERVKNDYIHFIEVESMMSIDLLEVILDTLTAQGFHLFLIDHLHYFDLLKGQQSKADYVEHVMVRLKQCQNKNGARIILIAHYRKLNGQKPTDAAFKDSMAIAQNANYTIHLWRDKSSDGTPGETEIFISKSRNPNGEAHITVEYDYDTNDYKTKEEGWVSGAYVKDKDNYQRLKNF